MWLGHLIMSHITVIFMSTILNQCFLFHYNLPYTGINTRMIKDITSIFSMFIAWNSIRISEPWNKHKWHTKMTYNNSFSDWYWKGKGNIRAGIASQQTEGYCLLWWRCFCFSWRSRWAASFLRAISSWVHLSCWEYDCELDISECVCWLPYWADELKKKKT